MYRSLQYVDAIKERGDNMSHAYGYVLQHGKVAAFFEYDGTVDAAISEIHYSEDGVELNWRTYKLKHCTCDNEPEDVGLFTDYGEGFTWKSKVCFKCMVIVGEREPDDTEVEGVPIEMRVFYDNKKNNT